MAQSLPRRQGNDERGKGEARWGRAYAGSRSLRSRRTHATGRWEAEGAARGANSEIATRALAPVGAKAARNDSEGGMEAIGGGAWKC